MSLSDVLFGTTEEQVERMLESSGKPEAQDTPKKRKSGKAARALGHRLSNKVIEHYEAQGYMAFRVDYTQAIYGGALQTMDMLGIGDVLTIGHGRTILVQSTVAESRTAHERKLCDDVRSLPRFGKSPYKLAHEWLAAGGEIELVSFEKDARGHWVPTVFGVTASWLTERLDKLKARRAA